MYKNIFLIVLSLLVATAAFADWKDSMSLKGEVRLRTEGIEDETKTGSAESRWRQRLRARLQLNAEVNKNVDAVIRLATGQNAGGKIADAVGSANETFDTYGSNKDFNLDMAYVSWKLLDGDLKLQGGKLKKALFRAGGSGLLWDSDWTPEGFQASYKGDMESWSIFSNLVGYYIDEDSGGQETGMLGLQAGVDFEAVVKVKLGAGYYTINSERFEVGAAKGNASQTISGTDFYLYNYNMLEGFLTVSMDMMDQPLEFYANYVNNSEADDNKDAMVFGLAYGKIKEVGDFKLDVHYMKIEKEAVFGILNDSNFNGGNTDGEGVTVGLWQRFAKNSKLGLRYLHAEQGISVDAGDKYDRYQLDFSFKF